MLSERTIQRILHVVRGNPRGMSLAHISKETELSRGKTRYVLLVLRRRGVVQNSKQGIWGIGNSEKLDWKLFPKGEEAQKVRLNYRTVVESIRRFGTMEYAFDLSEGEA